MIVSGIFPSCASSAHEATNSKDMPSTHGTPPSYFLDWRITKNESYPLTTSFAEVSKGSRADDFPQTPRLWRKEPAVRPFERTAGVKCVLSRLWRTCDDGHVGTLAIHATLEFVERPGSPSHHVEDQIFPGHETCDIEHELAVIGRLQHQS